MHDVLKLSKKWQSWSWPKRGFPRISFPKNIIVVTSEKIKKLLSQLISIDKFWQVQHIIEDTLIRIHYKEIVEKSNRITRILHNTDDDSVRGTTIEKKTTKVERLLITYFRLE